MSQYQATIWGRAIVCLLILLPLPKNSIILLDILLDTQPQLLKQLLKDLAVGKGNLDSPSAVAPLVDTNRSPETVGQARLQLPPLMGGFRRWVGRFRGAGKMPLDRLFHLTHRPSFGHGLLGQCYLRLSR